MKTEHIDTYYGSLKNMLDKFNRRSRQDAFKGSNPDEFMKWTGESRTLLGRIIGLGKMEYADLTPRILEEVQLEDGITRRKLLIQTEPDVFMPMYILWKTGLETSKLPVYLALPGHLGGGKYSVAGRDDLSVVKEKITYFGYDYGMQMARLGYLVICPDCRGFGERRDEALQNDSEEAFLNSTCFHLSHIAEVMGETVIGMITWDYMRLLDYLFSSKEFNSHNIGCIGFSGGGMQALWLAALDTRISKVAISGYFYGYRDSLMILNGNCSCNYVPGLYEHVDVGDIASLIAPRPVWIQSCRNDKLNGPRGILNVMEQLDILCSNYSVLQKEKNILHEICEGEHHFCNTNLKENLEFLDKNVTTEDEM